MSDNPRLREIRAKLDAIAPFPEAGNVTAEALARYFGVRAQERFTKMLHPAGQADVTQVAAMSAEFAAAHALYALAPLQLSALAAAQIRDAIEDGGGIGEWLYEHLGKETASAVSVLAEQLADVAAAESAGEVPDSQAASLRRHAGGLTRAWRAESARWHGFGSADPDPARRAGWAERSEVYAACADALERELAEAAPAERTEKADDRA
jgi:hypothetical protein